MAENFSKDNFDIFAAGVIKGIIKKRSDGVLQLMTELLANKEVSVIAEAAMKKQQAEHATVTLDAGTGSRSVNERKSLGW